MLLWWVLILLWEKWQKCLNEKRNPGWSYTNHEGCARGLQHFASGSLRAVSRSTEFERSMPQDACAGITVTWTWNIVFQQTPCVDFSYNEYAEANFRFYDNRLIEALRDEDKECALFFRLIAICHTVMPEILSDGKWKISSGFVIICPMLFDQAWVKPCNYICQKRCGSWYPPVRCKLVSD